MPEFYSNSAAEHGRGLDGFTRGYIMALYFTESGDWNEELTDEENSDNGAQFDVEDELAPCSLASIVEDCAAFQSSYAAQLSAYFSDSGNTLESAGSDFWFTRNGHGTGFWDRGPQSYLGELTEASRAYGSVYAYRGADGKVYV